MSLMESYSFKQFAHMTECNKGETLTENCINNSPLKAKKFVRKFVIPLVPNHLVTQFQLLVFSHVGIMG